ncbi:unknown similar to AMEV085 [Adoxophyes honmai entomopoxvirus 'L']|uniref:Uncharacterized protein n=1 Tax=Adoxophyes honmai entomopoxvirus 'L' TaxID=1293540 RepID=A0A916KP13_9POXV|nr:unknown similar to AMEV085 [Adoxophyes honmai entomopoxvirus 'L']CCU55404.1 unknown similar to AMEV085 [Adoxophyes honmai entomopoxvirus 'L']
MSNIYIILNMNKIVINNCGIYDIIPCKLSFSIIYKNYIISNRTFNIKYNLHEHKSYENKIKRAKEFLLMNNKNILFPTKEHKEKRVIRDYNAGHEPESIRNFIKSLIHIFIKYLNISPILVSSHNSNTMWVLNKIINGKLTSTVKYIDIPTIIIENIDCNNNCDDITDFCIKYIINNKFDTNKYSDEDSKILNSILEYESLLYDNNLLNM